MNIFALIDQELPLKPLKIFPNTISRCAHYILLTTYFVWLLNPFQESLRFFYKGFSIFFLFCCNLSFWVLSQFELSFVTICIFEFCHNLSLVLSLFEYSSFDIIWVFLVLSQFDFFFSFVSIWVGEKNVFWFLSQFDFVKYEFLSFVTIWVFVILSQFEFFSFVTF